MSPEPQVRIERDSLGEVPVPVTARYGAQTQRAVDNFPISGYRLPRDVIRGLATIKLAAALVNRELGQLEPARASAIATAAAEVAAGDWDQHFPVDVFQTGSGTSSNMNANEVIAHRAAELAPQLDPPPHPNDDVNRAQSSNDVFPSAVHLAALWGLEENLLPALRLLEDTLRAQAADHRSVVTIGRTHLMDAMPMTYGQIFDGYAHQIQAARQRLDEVVPGLAALPLGGTAVGTGINAPRGFGARAAAILAETTGLPLSEARNHVAAQSSIDPLIQASATVRGAALAVFKIAEDLRWLASGPRFGLAEIRLPALQPGSSIMPGKVNPVMEEAVIQVCCHVIGGDQAIASAGLCGHFALHTVLPLVAWHLPENIRILGSAITAFTRRSVAGLTVDSSRIAEGLARHPVLVTALVPRIGYAAAAEIAKQASASGRPVIDVAAECTDLDRPTLEQLLDPLRLTEGGVMDA